MVGFGLDVAEIPQKGSVDDDWNEEYAFTLGVQAYVYGFPWVYLSQLRWLWTTEAGKKVGKKIGGDLPYAPLNHFWNSRQLANADNRTGGAPNTDTLYSLAWLDLSVEPVILTVPKVKNRYYTMQMVCLDSDNFAYVGSRSTGDERNHYLIGGPGWKGRTPKGVLDVLPRSRTPAALIIGRTGVNNKTEEDLKEAHLIQDQYALTPLSAWPGPPPPARPTHVTVPVGFNYKDTKGAFKTMNDAMTENPPGLPPGIDQTELLKLFATVGVGPNESLAAQSQETRKGLERGADARQSLGYAAVLLPRIDPKMAPRRDAKMGN